MKHIILALFAVAFVSLSTVNAADLTSGFAQKQCSGGACDKAKGEKKPDDTKKE